MGPFGDGVIADGVADGGWTLFWPVRAGLELSFWP